VQRVVRSQNGGTARDGPADGPARRQQLNNARHWRHTIAQALALSLELCLACLATTLDAKKV
jgi:hypothetical protein